MGGGGGRLPPSPGGGGSPPVAVVVIPTPPVGLLWILPGTVPPIGTGGGGTALFRADIFAICPGSGIGTGIPPTPPTPLPTDCCCR